MHSEEGFRYNTPLQLTASPWKSFKILSYEILEARFGFSNKTLV